jgi:hypothetical protein
MVEEPEQWRAIRNITVMGSEIKEVYEVSSRGRVRRTTAHARFPAGYCLKISWDDGMARYFLREKNRGQNAVNFDALLAAVWPEVPASRPERSRVNALNAQNKRDNRELLAEKADARLFAAKKEFELVDPWESGEIRQRPWFRTPDPMMGF